MSQINCKGRQQSFSGSKGTARPCFCWYCSCGRCRSQDPAGAGHPPRAATHASVAAGRAIAAVAASVCITALFLHPRGARTVEDIWRLGRGGVWQATRSFCQQ
jgi:hypothetical protein